MHIFVNAIWLQKRFFTDFSKVYSDIVWIGYHIKSSDIQNIKKNYSETVLIIISDMSVDCEIISNCLDLGAQRDLTFPVCLIRYGMNDKD